MQLKKISSEKRFFCILSTSFWLMRNESIIVPIIKVLIFLISDQIWICKVLFSDYIPGNQQKKKKNFSEINPILIS